MSGLAGRGGHAHQNVDRTRDLLSSLAGGDARRLVEELEPEVELVASPPLAGSGSFHGQPGYLRWLERWEGSWERESLWVAMVEPVGARCTIATVSLRPKEGPGADSGDSTTMTWMFEFQRGRIARIALHPDRRAALDAARGASSSE